MPSPRTAAATRRASAEVGVGEPEVVGDEDVAGRRPRRRPAVGCGADGPAVGRAASSHAPRRTSGSVRSGP